jgi:hypothetical protein
MTHPIERKLRHEFCPYLVTARRLTRWTPYLVYTIYSYLGEVFILLAGFGLASPVMAFLAGSSADPPGVKPGGGTIIETLSESRFGWVAVVILVAWGLVKLYVQTEDLGKRCSLAASYRRQCLQIEHSLRKALPASDPMPALIQLQAKLSDLVDRSIAENAIPDLGIDDSLRHEMDALCNRLVADFGGFWAPGPDADRIR